MDGNAQQVGREALRSAALGPHTGLDELATSVAGAHPSNAEPRRVRELADTFMATISRHLSAVDDTLLPTARARMSDGRHLVTDYLTQARELEQGLHAVKAWMYGDVNARHLQGDRLWTDVRRLLAEHESREEALVDALAASLTAEDLDALAERLRRTEEHAPTRPHPYTVHTGLLGRPVHRAWSRVDGFWDLAESRVIPRPAVPPHPRRNSLVSRYVMGAPTFEEPDEE